MSRTIRRGKPSRNYHKYIGLGVITHENKRWFSSWSPPSYNGTLYWKDDENDTKTYEEYVAINIRQYHMDYRPYNKCPNWVHHMDIQYHRRQSKRAVYEAIRTGEFDVNLPTMGRVGKRIWEWW